MKILELRAVALRIALLAFVWWALTGGDPRSWWFGVPVTLIATLVSQQLAPDLHWPVRLRGALRFSFYFLWGSLSGAADVALRALHPRLPLEPDFIVYPVRLPPGPAQILFANTISLLPGTLSTDLRDSEMHVHTLSDGAQVPGSLRRLEAVVADVFGYTLPPAEPPRRTPGARASGRPKEERGRP